MQDFRGRKFSVIGAARSGIGAARVLKSLGARVLLTDSRQAEALGALEAEARATGAECVFGADVQTALPQGTEFVVTSPGVPKSAPILQAAVKRGFPVWSEIELAYRISGAPIIGVTGTNGKTTTTLLLAAMLQAAKINAAACGNISADEIKKTLVEAAWENSFSAGSSAPRLAEGSTGYYFNAPYPDNVLVAEISSFQLEWVEQFAPQVAILTNVTPDHLNRHNDFAEYARTKAKIFAAQTSGDWAVVGYDNPTSRAIGENGLTAQRVWFTTRNMPPDDTPAAWVQDGILTVRLKRDQPPALLMRADALPSSLPGTHSIANTLAASVAALALGAPREAIMDAARNFHGVAHRMEWVADIQGVHYVNNSMCTNVAAAVCSLESMQRPAIVIAGGADKDLDFKPLARTLIAKAKHLILIGTAAEKMETTFRAGGYDAISRAGTLEAAVCMAQQRAIKGDAVLLSPACASFDMFRDFEARGAAFRDAVRRLQEECE